MIHKSKEAGKCWEEKGHNLFQQREEQGLVRMDVSKSRIKRLSVKAPMASGAVIHEFSNKGHKAKGKNKRKSKVL